MDDVLVRRIEHQKNNHLYRRRFVRNKASKLQSMQFCSSDYLGLAQHPAVIGAFKQAADDYGVSGSSSSVVTGYTDAHQQLELAFAKFLKYDAALLFSCGYMANLGLLSVLANRNTVVFADKLIHASLIDAIQLSKAKLLRFSHRDYAQLERLLANTHSINPLVVTDSVFSMQGDMADLPTMSILCQKYQATLIVDDAHGIGVLGKSGAGISEHYALTTRDVPILVCPLAKAFGVMGAVVLGSQTLIDALIQFARPYIYTNALPPALAFAGLASLEQVQAETWRREKLQHLIQYFRESAKTLGLPLADSVTPIQPIVIGSSVKAQAISEKLLAEGIVLNAMRPPTVTEKSTCLRVSLTCLHEEPHIWQLLVSVKKIYDHLS